MPKQIFNRKKIDFTKQPMFFGEDLGVQRYDVYKYPFFDQSTQRQLGFPSISFNSPKAKLQAKET